MNLADNDYTCNGVGSVFAGEGHPASCREGAEVGGEAHVQPCPAWRVEGGSCVHDEGQGHEEELIAVSCSLRRITRDMQYNLCEGLVLSCSFKLFTMGAMILMLASVGFAWVGLRTGQRYHALSACMWAGALHSRSAIHVGVHLEALGLCSSLCSSLSRAARGEVRERRPVC